MVSAQLAEISRTAQGESPEPHKAILDQCRSAAANRIPGEGTVKKS